MEKYLGIYNNNSLCDIDSICFDTDDTILEDTQYEQAETIKDLENNNTDKKYLHVYEAYTNEYDVTTYKYLTTIIIK